MRKWFIHTNKCLIGSSDLILKMSPVCYIFFNNFIIKLTKKTKRAAKKH